ncbi:MAG TPA: acetyl-CoA carboxylase biotin carboxyl carrier protein subunit [Gemmatimonadales bacterium]|nr:acetyl-CoA carboxylase biotin carboxyl carrier protein subunit [Gemmatimonadales bacterium]
MSPKLPASRRILSRLASAAALNVERQSQRDQLRAITADRPSIGVSRLPRASAVEPGAGLVVVEAMKLENELRAPHAGIVETVHVAAGQTVEKGMPLVTLAPTAGAA